MLYDFIDGSLACKGAEDAVANALRYIEKETSAPLEGPDVIQAPLPILFVCDHHPSDHCSFLSEGGTWPPHCVIGTRGAEVHDSLKPYVHDEFTFYKGFKKEKEQYSGFEGMNDAGQTLADVLDIMGIRNVVVCGIATEFCVRSTCEDILKSGYAVYLLQDCVGYVDGKGHEKALAEMKEEGIKLISVDK